MRRLRIEPATISPIRTTIAAAPNPATYFSRRDITVENSTLAADVRPRTYRSCPFDAEARRRGERRGEKHGQAGEKEQDSPLHSDIGTNSAETRWRQPTFLRFLSALRS